MNRRSFALSWGRKVFFGIGWPIFCLVAFGYFQSRIVPTSGLGIFYYLITQIGHYGLLTAVLYFVLYVPLASLLPYYYFTRIWSMLLIVFTGLLIYLDSIVFSLHRFHINSFVLDLIFGGESKDLFSLQPSLYIIMGCMLTAAMVYIWYRGERIWRHMQRRFSNTNKNWYLVLIAAFVILGQLMHIYGDAYGNRNITRYAQNFPLYFPATARRFLANADFLPEKLEVQEGVERDFKYPAEKMSCPGEDDRNVLIITVNDWKAGALGPEVTPLLEHYAGHGHNFLDHHSGSTGHKGGIFSLFYGLPETYWPSADQDQVDPVFMDELIRRNYDMGVFSASSLEDSGLLRTVFLRAPAHRTTPNLNEEWRAWLEGHLSKAPERPFFGYLNFSNPQGIDAKVSEVVEGLHAKGLLNETAIIITGSNGQDLPEGIKVPLIFVWPGERGSAVSSFTSHYDVIPTLMGKLWNCSTPMDKFSDGHSLFERRPRDWHLVGTAGGYEIIDFKERNIVTVGPDMGYEVTDFTMAPQDRSLARQEIILSVLKQKARFRKKTKI